MKKLFFIIVIVLSSCSTYKDLTRTTNPEYVTTISKEKITQINNDKTQFQINVINALIIIVRLTHIIPII